MEALLYYGIFAVTTATVCVMHFFYPLLKELEVSHPQINVVKYFKTTIVTFWLFTLLIAPFMIFPYLFKTMGDRFRAGLFRALTQQN